MYFGQRGTNAALGKQDIAWCSMASRGLYETANTTGIAALPIPQVELQYTLRPDHSRHMHITLHLMCIWRPDENAESHQKMHVNMVQSVRKEYNMAFNS